MSDLFDIDGSVGEGGGQILRSSLALSLITGRPIRLQNIRAGRAKPGLMRQHLTAVNAAAEIGNAQVSGAQIGSQSLTFVPRAVKPGKYHFSVGTAGSATLVLQTVLPALLIAAGPSEVTLEGGTHNQWAPPFHFLQHAFLPIVNRLGPRVQATIDRHGFYPAGGGRFTVSIEPTPVLKGFDLLQRGALKSRSATALVANLPLHIAKRETERVLRKLSWDRDFAVHEEVLATGPGNVVFAMVEYEHATEVFTGFGRIGASAEAVADEVIRDARNYLKSEAPIGEYLADQLMLPWGIAAWQRSQAGASAQDWSLHTLPLSRHSTTHLQLLRDFLQVQIDVTADEPSTSTTICFRNGNATPILPVSLPEHPQEDRFAS